MDYTATLGVTDRSQFCPDIALTRTLRGSRLNAKAKSSSSITNEPAMSQQRRLLVPALLMAAMSGCAVVELSGTMTRKTGEVMTDYSKQDSGIVGKAAGFGGRVNTAVGGTVEDVAKKGKNADPAESKTSQFVSANKRVITSGYDAAVSKPTNGTTPAGAGPSRELIVQAQRRLQELGYDVGTPDGVVGARSRAAIGRYQEKYGLPVTKTFDRATIESLGIAGDSKP